MGHRTVLLLLAMAFPLMADVDYDDTPTTDNQGHPFTFHAQYDSIGGASFSDSPLKRQTISFQQAMTYASLVWHYNEGMQRGSYALIGYTQTKIGWSENPFFDQNHFKELNIGIGFFTKQLCDWTWQLRVIGNFDTEHGPVGRYSTYDILIWGDYIWTPRTHLHCGVCAYTGMRIDWVYPVIGFDYYISEKWKLNAVFPLDMSLVYNITPKLSTSLAAHFYRSRHRVGEREVFSEGLLQYQNNGIELKINYEWSDGFNFNIYGGEAFGGRFKVSNRKNHNSKRLDFGSSGFFGGELNLLY